MQGLSLTVEYCAVLPACQAGYAPMSCQGPAREFSGCFGDSVGEGR
jgi:hypothetical protein